jgi:hypothetical protein
LPKRSASKLLPDPVFFTDADFGPTEGCDVVTIFRAAGLTVEPHHAHFPPPGSGGRPTPDHVWLAECARRGWVAVSKDDQIRYSPLAKQVIMENGVQLFVCIGAWSHPRLAQNFVHTLPRIHRLLGRLGDQPFIARVYMVTDDDDFASGESGNIKLWLTRDEWLAETGR